MVSIHLSKYDVSKIIRWNANNSDKRDNCTGKFPYSRFTVEIEKGDKDFGGMVFDVSLVDGDLDNGYVYCYNGTDECSFNLDGNDFDEIIKIMENVSDLSSFFAESKKFSKNEKSEFQRYWFYTFIVGFMAYVICKAEKKPVEHRVSTKKVNASASKPSTHTEKTHYLLDDMVRYYSEYKGGHHTITCPAWTTRGHYRHYKNGKVVWVRECVKGKDKDMILNTDVYLSV